MNFDLLWPIDAKKASAGVYLNWSRHAAMADWILGHAQTFEVPLDYKVPDVTELDNTMPKYPRTHDRYYQDGGTHWPSRIVCVSSGDG